jgi:hypothetical protein
LAIPLTAELGHIFTRQLQWENEQCPPSVRLVQISCACLALVASFVAGCLQCYSATNYSGLLFLLLQFVLCCQRYQEGEFGLRTCLCFGSTGSLTAYDRAVQAQALLVLRADVAIQTYQGLGTMVIAKG